MGTVGSAQKRAAAWDSAREARVWACDKARAWASRSGKSSGSSCQRPQIASSRHASPELAVKLSHLLIVGVFLTPGVEGHEQGAPMGRRDGAGEEDHGQGPGDGSGLALGLPAPGAEPGKPRVGPQGLKVGVCEGPLTPPVPVGPRRFENPQGFVRFPHPTQEARYPGLGSQATARASWYSPRP